MGVYLSELLADAQQYATLNLNQYEHIRTYLTDGTGKFRMDQLFGARYYFPNLHAEDSVWDKEETYVDMSLLGSGIPVEPMLAISAQQSRQPSPGGDGARNFVPERFTLLFGITMDECENCVSRVNPVRRDIERFPEAFETAGIAALCSAEASDLILMDEIGRMEEEATRFPARAGAAEWENARSRPTPAKGGYRAGPRDSEASARMAAGDRRRKPKRALGADRSNACAGRRSRWLEKSRLNFRTRWIPAKDK